MNEQKSDLRMTLLSDIHVTWFDEFHYEAEKELRRIFAYKKDNLPKSDAYLFSGDTVYQVEASTKAKCEVLYPVIYDRLKGVLNDFIPDTPRVMIMGNHEYPQCNTDEDITMEARKLYADAYGEPMNVHKVINGYHVIGVSILSWAIPQSDENEAWAMKEIDAAIAEDPYKPVFFMVHNPIPQTTTGSYGAAVKQYSPAFRAWLETKPQVIVLSGHCHNLGEDDSIVWQSGFTHISAPVIAVGYIEVNGECVPGYESIRPFYFGKSQFIDLIVNKYVVTAVCYDAVSQTEINRWTFDIEAKVKGTDAGLYTAEAHDAWEAPAFADDAYVAVITDASGAKKIAIRQSFAPYAHCIKFFTVVYKNRTNGEEKVMSFATEFYKVDKSEAVLRKVPELASGEYDVTVYAVNAFGKKCANPVSAVLSI